MYLDVSGPSVTGGHPSPPKARRFHQQQPPPRGCPWSRLKWVPVVFTRLRVRNACTVLAAQLPWVGGG